MHRRELLTLGALTLLPVPAYAQTSRPRSVATMGHLGHGKSTLAAALSQVLAHRGQASPVAYADVDRASPNREAAVPFSAFELEFRHRGRTYRDTDCPEHADYVKAVLTGSVHMDATVLVVSAQEGLMPETRKHAVLARAAGVRRMVLFVNKIDRARDPAVLDAVERDAKELLVALGFQRAIPVIRGSALLALQAPNAEHKDAACIWELVGALHGTPQRPAVKRAGGRPKTRLDAIAYMLTAAEGGRSLAFPDEYHAKLRFGTNEVDAKISGIGRANELGPEVEVAIETAGGGIACDAGWEFTLHEADRLVGIGLVTKAETAPPSLRRSRAGA